ncbi:DUF2964 family protein [Burkholderia territorii]|uniref:DUF2964 family protein n=1 Tax=Burkholderia territorii TaxID=1503055 RepID=UPI0039BFEA69
MYSIAHGRAGGLTRINQKLGGDGRFCRLTQINRATRRDAIMTERTSPKGAARRTFRIRPTIDAIALRETVMIRKQYRIVLATLSVFIAIASLVGIVHGMLFDEEVFRYSIVTLISSILAFVVLLNPGPGERP